MVKNLPLNKAVLLILSISWCLFVIVSNNESYDEYTANLLTNIPDIVEASLFESYRTFTSLFLSNHGPFELVTNSFELIILGFIMNGVMTNLEFLSVFIISGSIGNLFADFFIVFLSRESAPSFLSTMGISDFSVGMSTALCGLLFYSLSVSIYSGLHGKIRQRDFYILSFFASVTVLPWLYPFFGKAPLDIVDYVHFFGSLIGLTLGIIYIAIKRNASP
ncbi:rhomboid family intramembrane serine protease [Lacticaseibacillus rhamnosus]|uniref:rhomboid family intramembrane serine protease n=1 Tax=Lacticaseibacillus rhamnosus TaxID=47715 RepID=UPI003065A3BD